MSESGGVHHEDPFATPAAERSPSRRLRGGLPHPVTIWTATGTEGHAGLTMSSVLVADGEPPQVLGLVAPTTELFGVLSETGRFVVHVLERDDWKLADIFAGLRPNPGGPFAGLRIEISDYGPVFRSPMVAYCTVVEIETVGYHELVTAAVDRVDAGHLTDPLVHFRGRYRHLTDQ